MEDAPTLSRLDKGGIYDNSDGSINTYFGYYSKLANQQNMMSDSVRTGLYYDAILQNKYPPSLTQEERTSRTRLSWT